MGISARWGPFLQQTMAISAMIGIIIVREEGMVAADAKRRCRFEIRELEAER